MTCQRSVEAMVIWWIIGELSWWIVLNCLLSIGELSIGELWIVYWWIVLKKKEKKIGSFCNFSYPMQKTYWMSNDWLIANEQLG